MSRTNKSRRTAPLCNVTAGSSATNYTSSATSDSDLKSEINSGSRIKYFEARRQRLNSKSILQNMMVNKTKNRCQWSLKGVDDLKETSLNRNFRKGIWRAIFIKYQNTDLRIIFHTPCPPKLKHSLNTQLVESKIRSNRQL